MKTLGIFLFAFLCLTAQSYYCGLGLGTTTSALNARLVNGRGPGLGSALLPINSVIVHETDGLNQSGRPITFGRAFRVGEFQECLQPMIARTLVRDYQVDVKNRWSDGSIKFAVVSLIVPNLPALGNATIEFHPASSCKNIGYLSRSQMINFNSGNWGAEIRVSAGGTTIATDAATILAHADPAADTVGDCQNDYWLQGSVVTAVIVQDCTFKTAYDFGWTWNGTTMHGLTTGNCSGAARCTASLHPWFVLYFYPSCNCVRADMVLENDWSDRAQNQLINVDYYTGATPTKVWGYDGPARIITSATLTANSDVITSPEANFSARDVGSSIGTPSIATSRLYDTTICSVQSATQATLCAPALSSSTNQTVAVNMWYWQQMYRKTFWTGNGNPGNYLIDHNWPYMVSTGMVPPYDITKSASPDSKALGGESNSATDDCELNSGTDFTCMVQHNLLNNGFAQTWSDMGDRGGHGRIDEGFQQTDGDPTPMPRQTLLYLTNMATCGKSNGACAKAWLMLTGEWGARDSSLAGAITALNTGAAHGGAGIFNNAGNITYHLRESRTTNPPGGGQHYFCPNLAAGKYAAIGPEVGINVLNDSTRCGTSTDTSFGRPFSRYFDPNGDAKAPLGVPPGAQSPYNNQGRWTPLPIRWLEWTYAAYLLTGDYYYAVESQMNGAWAASAITSGAVDWTSNGFFAFMNFSHAALRQNAGLLDAALKAYVVSPDGSLEQKYFDSILASNAEVYEGLLGIVGTSLTPNATNEPNTTCDMSRYTIRATNRWDWGRCTVISFCGSDELQGASSCRPVGPSLHVYWPGQTMQALIGNVNFAGFTLGYAIAGNPTEVVSQSLTGSSPAPGYNIFIANAQPPWTAINGLHTVLTASTTTSNCPVENCRVYAIDADTSGTTSGRITGSVAAYYGSFGSIRTATVGPNTTITTVANAGTAGGSYPYLIYGCVDEAGGVIPNWSKLNGLRVLTAVSGRVNEATVKGGFKTTGFPPFSQSGCFINNIGIDPVHTTDFIQGWMENLAAISINEMAGKGVTYFNAVAKETNYRLLEKILDPNWNPYLVGLNVQPLKSPSGNQSLTSGDDTNPLLATWAQMAGALPPQSVGQASPPLRTFWSSPAYGAGGNPCTAHSYALLARAAAAYLPGTTDTTDPNIPPTIEGAPNGTAAWNWISTNMPFFSHRPPNGDQSCADAGLPDNQIKFAFRPR
jgi:hypothetical protein